MALIAGVVAPIIRPWDTDAKWALLENCSLFALGELPISLLLLTAAWRARRRTGRLRTVVLLATRVTWWRCIGRFATLAMFAVASGLLIAASSIGDVRLEWSAIGIYFGIVMGFSAHIPVVVEIRQRGMVFGVASIPFSDVSRFCWHHDKLQLRMPQVMIEIPIAPSQCERMKAILAEMRPDLALKASELPAP